MGAVSHPAKAVDPFDNDFRKLVQRILESPEFRRAPRLKALLIYICDRFFEQPHAEIREQELGSQIFGRPQNYNTSEDPIVRVQVSQLRKKLKQYFENEGRDETLILDIPRGTYLPAFVARPEELAKTETVPPTVSSRRNTALWAIVALLCIAVLLVLFKTHRTSKPDVAKPLLVTFWANLIQPSQRTTVILADSCLTFAEDIMHHPVSLREYLTQDPESWLSGVNLQPAEARDLELLMTRQYTSLADLNDSATSCSRIRAISRN